LPLAAGAHHDLSCDPMEALPHGEPIGRAGGRARFASRTQSQLPPAITIAWRWLAGTAAHHSATFSFSDLCWRKRRWRVSATGRSRCVTSGGVMGFGINAATDVGSR